MKTNKEILQAGSKKVVTPPPLKKGKEERLKEINDIHRLFMNAFPKVFTKVPERLLKINIHLSPEIYEIFPFLTQTKVRRFLKYYCNNKFYLKLHVYRAVRYDLFGVPSGEVTLKEIEEIRLLKKTMKEKYAKKKNFSKPNGKERVVLSQNMFRPKIFS